MKGDDGNVTINRRTLEELVALASAEADALRAERDTFRSALAEVMREDDLHHPCDHPHDPANGCTHCAARGLLAMTTTDGGGGYGVGGGTRAHGAMDSGRRGFGAGGRTCLRLSCDYHDGRVGA